MKGCSKVVLKPPLLQAKQPQFSQPVFTRELLQPSHHLCDPTLDTLQQVHVLTLGIPELDTVMIHPECLETESTCTYRKTRKCLRLELYPIQRALFSFQHSACCAIWDPLCNLAYSCHSWKTWVSSQPHAMPANPMQMSRVPRASHFTLKASIWLAEPWKCQ